MNLPSPSFPNALAAWRISTDNLPLEDLSRKSLYVCNKRERLADVGEEKLPEPMLAIFAEGIVISRAALKSLRGGRGQEKTFCPNSVVHFAWPVLDFVTVDR